MNTHTVRIAIIATVVICFGSASMFVTAQIPDPLDETVAAVRGDEQARAALEAQCIATINSQEASWLEKDRACRKLAVIGTAQSVAALAALLDDPELSSVARVALQVMPYSEVDDVLREAVKRTSGPLQAGIISSIGYRRDAKAVEQLGELVQSDDTSVAAAAVYALGRIGTPGAAQTLTALTQRNDQALREAAAQALLIAVDRLAEQGHGNQAAAICRQLINENWPLHIRTGAFLGMLQAQPQQANVHLLATIRDARSPFRYTAISTLATLPGQNLTERFAAELPRLSDDVQVLLIDALARRDDPAARPAMHQALQSDAEAVRLAAMQALGSLGDVTSVAPLCTVVTQSAGRQERLAAIETLRRLGDAGVDAALIEQMRQLPADQRGHIMEVFVQRGTTGAVGELLEQIQHEAARAAAFRALGHLAQPEHIGTLLEKLMAFEDERSRQAAQRAIIQVAGRARERERHEPIIAALQQATIAADKASLIRILGGIGGKPAFDAVQAHVNVDEPTVRDAAIRTLADWPDPIAAAVLAEIYSHSADTAHRGLALRGCVRLLRQSDQPAGEKLSMYQRLIDASRESSQRSLILAGLAEVADPAALQTMKPLFDDAQVRGEAEIAQLRIAKAIAEKHPEQALAAARHLQAEANSEDVKQQAEELAANIESKMQDEDRQD